MYECKKNNAEYTRHRNELKEGEQMKTMKFNGKQS